MSKLRDFNVLEIVIVCSHPNVRTIARRAARESSKADTPDGIESHGKGIKNGND